MQKWLMTIRSFNMLICFVLLLVLEFFLKKGFPKKNKKARIVPGFFIFVKLFYLKEFRGISPNIR